MSMAVWQIFKDNVGDLWWTHAVMPSSLIYLVICNVFQSFSWRNLQKHDWTKIPLFGKVSCESFSFFWVATSAALRNLLLSYSHNFVRSNRIVFTFQELLYVPVWDVLISNGWHRALKNSLTLRFLHDSTNSVVRSRANRDKSVGKMIRDVLIFV